MVLRHTNEPNCRFFLSTLKKSLQHLSFLDFIFQLSRHLLKKTTPKQVGYFHPHGQSGESTEKQPCHIHGVKLSIEIDLPCLFAKTYAAFVQKLLWIFTQRILQSFILSSKHS